MDNKELLLLEAAGELIAFNLKELMGALPHVIPSESLKVPPGILVVGAMHVTSPLTFVGHAGPVLCGLHLGETTRSCRYLIGSHEHAVHIEALLMKILPKLDLLPIPILRE